jgi:hypothetical protein
MTRFSGKIGFGGGGAGCIAGLFGMFNDFPRSLRFSVRIVGVLCAERNWISWARLAAASGLVAVTYTNEDSATDARTVLEYVKRNAASFGVDEQKIGVWACSGNVPTALSLLMQDAETRVRCAVLAYG